MMRISENYMFFILSVLGLILCSGFVSAENMFHGEPLIGVKELSRQGRHFDALMMYKENENSHSLGEIFAVARSAWALGLVNEARKRWDEALQHPECSGTERARVYLSRAIMELQEGDYEKARSFAEEGSSIIEASELRGELFFVVAEALYSQKMFSLSERYYDRVVREGSKERSQESLLQLARVRFSLGRFAEARKTLTQIELTSKFTPEAISELLHIDLKNRNHSGVRTWVEEGRTSYPSEFRSPKVSYQHATALASEGLLLEAEEEVAYISAHSKENDPWLNLGRALIEAEYAKELVVEDNEDISR
jgi:tetratricopeptide (TPR) repeat protein